ncbi:MAG: hypothetical protein WDZ69_01675 [Candidatus Pacearchaeota archaeon]
MENKYQNRKELLERSPIIEDAAYQMGYSPNENTAYAVGNSKCGSKCSSRSSASMARGNSLVEKVEKTLER